MKNLYYVVLATGLCSYGCKPKSHDEKPVSIEKIIADYEKESKNLKPQEEVKISEQAHSKEEIKPEVLEKTYSTNVIEIAKKRLLNVKVEDVTAQIYLPYFETSDMQISGVIHIGSLSKRELQITKAYNTPYDKREIEITIRGIPDSPEMNRIYIYERDGTGISGMIDISKEDKKGYWENWENSRMISQEIREEQIKSIFQNTERKWGDYFRQHHENMQFIQAEIDNIYEKELTKTKKSLEKVMDFLNK